MDSKDLEYLVCPESKQVLSLASADVVYRLNQAICEGKIQNLSGCLLQDKVQGLLVREDRKRAYPILDDIPLLIAEAALDWGLLNGQ